jgi:MraZ protein
MNGLIGEYNCRLDEKGRLTLPSRLRAQFPESAGNQLVVNRGFEKCLVLYTKEDWLKETAKLGDVDDFMSPEIRRFKRIFTNGATLVQIDNAQRILVPKNLLEYADLHDDVILNASGSKVEIWSQANYEKELAADADEMSRLAQNFFQQQKGVKNKE